jgi:hypothetical protein
MSAQAVRDDLGSRFGYKALAYGTVKKYLRTARFHPAKDPLHLTSTIPIRSSWQPLTKNHFRQCGGLHGPLIFHE